MNIAQITQYFNIGLLVLFLLIVVGLVIAALRGLARGVWKSTHNMVFMLSLIFIAFFTLNSITDIIGSFQISFFFKGSLYVSREIDGTVVTYYAPITTVKETLIEFIKGIYTLYNVSASPASATNFALALVSSALKVVIFIVEMILIVTLGNLFSFLTWFLIFKHFVPKIARKVVKIRWLGMLETMVTFLVVTVLFMTPFTSLVNSINMSYQKHRPTSDNETIVNIGNFVDAYNDSLFAKVLFNWSYDEKTGTTFDTRLFDKLTTGVSEDVSISLVGEFTNLLNLVVSSTSAVSSSSDGQYSFDPTALASQTVVDSAFDAIMNSDVITSIFPVIVEIATNSDMLDGFIPNRLIDLSDVKWNEEIGYVKEMVDCVFESHVIDSIFTLDKDGHRVFRSFEGNDLVHFIEKIIYDEENFEHILDIFKSIDKSKVLSRVVPAVLQFVISSDQTGNVAKYLPLSWEEMNRFSWGFETFIFFDFMHSIFLTDQDFVKALFVKTGMYTPEDGEEIKTFEKLLSENLADFKSLLVGQFDEDGQPVNVDKRGVTLVFDSNGQRIKDGDKERHYCLFDMNMISTALPVALDSLFELDLLGDLKNGISENDLEPFHQAVTALNTGNRLKNYKVEFEAILDVFATLAEDTELLENITAGKGIDGLMEEEGNFFSIKKTHITKLQEGIAKMDRSSLLYSVLTPIFKSMLTQDTTQSSFEQIGLNMDVITSAIDYDMSSGNHKFFTNFSSLLDNWDDINTLFSITKGDTNDMMNQFAQESTKDAFVRLLKALKNNKIINPTSELTGGKYPDNENLYAMLLNIFGMIPNLNVERSTLEKVETKHTWDDEFDSIGNIISFIASHDITNASSALSGGLNRDSIYRLKEEKSEEHPDNFDLPGLFSVLGSSYIFAETMGPYLDETLGSSMGDFLFEKGENISFSNVTDWAKEGQTIKGLLDAMYNITPSSGSSDIFSDFSIEKFDNIIDLNDMLHDLAHSGIFTYLDVEDGKSHFLFGKWLYGKVESSMGKFSVTKESSGGSTTNDYDLLADPRVSDEKVWGWDANWGVRPEDSETPDQYFLEWKNKYDEAGTAADKHYIAYKDFAFVNGLADDNESLPTFWCDYAVYKAQSAIFLAAHKDDLTTTYVDPLTNEWGKYYASDDFIADYENVFEVDEISRVVKFMSYAMRIMNPKDELHGGKKMDFDKIPTKLLEGMLYSLNDTHCLRISIYNFYRIAAENVFSGYNGFSLTNSYNIYMVDGDVGMYNFDVAHDKRQSELEKLVSFYNVIDEAKQKGILEGSSFQYAKMNDDAFMGHLKTALEGMNDSYVFHRKGSALLADQKTTFQELFNTLLGGSETKNIIYLGANSPKDAANTALGLYTDGDSKVTYLVNNTFLTDSDINDLVSGDPEPETAFINKRNAQLAEVDNLVDSIHNIYSLKDKDDNSVTSIDAADMNKAENRDIIHDLLTRLNNSDLLYDIVPNTIYNLFIKNDKFNIQSGSTTVNFKQADPFYHYYYIDRTHPDFTAKYTTKDISGIDNLLGDYQEYNEKLKLGSKITDKVVLKALIDEDESDGFQPTGALPNLLKHLHDCNIFHSPARNYPDGVYYTDKFDDDGYTLFEELMSKICTFTGLDAYAYDEAYALDVATYGDIEHGGVTNKLKANVKALTLADDTGSSSTYYHTEQGHAWNDEIDTFMKLAYTACNFGTGTEIAVSNLEINKMKPADVKTMLGAVNDCDLICDAVPGFVKKGFTTINLGTLTTYNAQNYAVYHLGQEAYGGEDGLCAVGTEIDNITEVMRALNKGTEDEPNYSTNMNNLKEFVNGSGDGKPLTGLLRFIYQSHIFNTSLSGTYNAMNEIEGRNVSARGILLYNSMGNDLHAYVARAVHDPREVAVPAKEALDKMASLSKILAMKNYFDAEDNDITYQVESQGLKKLIELVDTDGKQINASTFSSNNIQDVKDRKDVILGIIECAYNATNKADPAEYQRSAIVSEFISGLFNTILENQYSKITNNPGSYPGYDYMAYGFGNDNAATLTIADYASLNKAERDGVEGILNCLDCFGSGTAIQIAMSMIAHKDELKAYFAQMGQTPETNSIIARAIYLSEAHKYFKQLSENANVKDSGGNQFNCVDATTKDPTHTNNIYSYSEAYKFSFKDYGERIDAFLNDAHITL